MMAQKSDEVRSTVRHQGTGVEPSAISTHCRKTNRGAVTLKKQHRKRHSDAAWF